MWKKMLNEAEKTPSKDKPSVYAADPMLNGWKFLFFSVWKKKTDCV